MKPSDDPRIDYRRGRSGRPLQRIRTQLKREGSHICVLCGTAINMNLPSTHRMSWTLEHIVPLDIDPSLWNHPENLAEAHKTCNSARGKRDSMPRLKGSRQW